MTFLCMETGGSLATLVLVDFPNGRIREFVVFEGHRTLSVRLFGEIDNLLKSNGLALTNLTGFAVGIGPGSFTGVRVGVTTAKTLAQVTGKPLIGVGTLDAYAAALTSKIAPDTCLVPVIHSRRDEVYTAIYLNGNTVEEPFAATVEELRARLALLALPAVFCGSEELSPLFPENYISLQSTPPEGLAAITAKRFALGEFDSPFSLVPLYVVPPAISTPKDPTVIPQGS